MFECQLWFIIIGIYYRIDVFLEFCSKKNNTASEQ